MEGDGRHHAVQREGALVRRARLYLTLGALGKAEADLVAAQRVPTPRHMYQVHLETTLGRLYTLRGDHEAAAEVFARVEARLREAASPRVRALVRFVQATALPRAARLDLAEEVLALSQKLELPSLDIGARTLYAQRLLAAGDPAGARSNTREAVTLMDTHTSGYLYPGEVLLTHFQALRAAHDPGARSALVRALAFLTDTALPNVPEAYRQSFLEGAVNREILAEAARFGLGPLERPGREGP